ncbi:MAG: hypothetical protein U0794_03160 [Isosphaeraceae bacterium]
MLANCESNRADTLAELGRLGEARETYLVAIDLYTRLAARFPDETEFPWSIALNQVGLARVLDRLRQTTEALVAAETALKRYEVLKPRLHDDTDFNDNLQEATDLLLRLRSATSGSRKLK